MAPVKAFDRLAEPQSRVYRQKMVRILEKAWNAFGGESPTQREYEKVMLDTPLEPTSPDDHETLIRVVVGNLRLRQGDALRPHRMGQVEEDVLQFEAAEGQPDQRREEGEFTMARDERDPVFSPQPLRQTFRRDHTSKAAAQHENICHIQLLKTSVFRKSASVITLRYATSPPPRSFMPIILSSKAYRLHRLKGLD
jgi:hypothetical protein